MSTCHAQAENTAAKRTMPQREEAAELDSTDCTGVAAQFDSRSWALASFFFVWPPHSSVELMMVCG